MLAITYTKITKIKVAEWGTPKKNLVTHMTELERHTVFHYIQVEIGYKKIPLFLQITLLKKPPF
jgi:hypothetical protein